MQPWRDAQPRLIGGEGVNRWKAVYSAQAEGFSQGDLERASGLVRSYISRVERGHTVPSIETLERFAAALGVPLYQLFYEGEEPPPTPHLTYRPTLEELANEPGGRRQKPAP